MIKLKRKEISMKNNSIVITSFESIFDDRFGPRVGSLSFVWMLVSSSVSSFRRMLDLPEMHPEVSSEMMESSGDIRLVNCLLAACGLIKQKYRLIFIST